MRTSITHPLKIDIVPVGKGRLGLTFCPGKTQADAATGAWARDLDLDLEAIRSAGTAAVVTLMESHEFGRVEVSLAELCDRLARHGIEWHHLPIRDAGIPGEAFERAWSYAGPRLHSRLRHGGLVVVHCMGGLGRTGAVAARLLVETGIPPDNAIVRVRQARPGSIETPGQEAYVGSMAAVGEGAMRHRERVAACLLGGAVGDAFGYTVEFKSLTDIKDRFGPCGIRKPELRGGRLIVSDDTQMTLFTLEGALRAAEAGSRDPSAWVAEIRKAYLDWLFTQSGEEAGSLAGWLGKEPAMRADRAPGTTCLGALRAGATGSSEKPINDSKGCGGVMRTAPIGWFFPMRTAFRVGVEAAALTHGHPSGYLSAGALSAIVRDLLDSMDLDSAAQRALTELGNWPGQDETSVALAKALRLARTPSPNPEDDVRALGAGWVGEEALGIGIYACLRGQDYAEAMAIAANHDGDSDSTASIAGQIWGAWKGLLDLPHDWVMALDVLQPALRLIRQAQHVLPNRGEAAERA